MARRKPQLSDRAYEAAAKCAESWNIYADGSCAANYVRRGGSGIYDAYCNRRQIGEDAIEAMRAGESRGLLLTYG